MRRSLNALLMLAIVLVAPVIAVPASRAMAQDSVEITMWLDTTGGAENAECLDRQRRRAIQRPGNGTTVEATLQANDWDATRTALAGGAGPDIVGTPGPSFAMQLAQAGQLVAARRLRRAVSAGTSGFAEGRSTSARRTASSTPSRPRSKRSSSTTTRPSSSRTAGPADDAGRADGARRDRSTPRASSRSPTPTPSGDRPTSGSSASSSTTAPADRRRSTTR